MDHVNAVLERDANNIVLSEVGTDGGETSSNAVRFIRLGPNVTNECQETTREARTF